ncbi:MAG TPA: 4'-phosphopantetheinyl transferase superfamily protein [Terriglobales bacterium]|nr:4'-phosphopantetheinyl transferase superfamily protein [Terriglobales bacterium]
MLQPPLSRNEVHVWLVPIAPDCVEPLSPLLAPAERARASQFRFARDSQQFIVACASRRILLGEYLNMDPLTLRFGEGANGKPFLLDGSHRSRLRFNTSHCQGLVIHAFASDREVGIDIESVSDRLETETIAARFFSPREHAALRALPKADQATGFLSLWTRKEALLKAAGLGLSWPLDSVEFSWSAKEIVAVKTNDPATPIWWSVCELPVPAGYVGALAAAGDGYWVKTFNWCEKREHRAELAPAR